MRTIAWDTWAFLEVAMDGPRGPDVEALASEVDVTLTVREVVAETFTFLARRSGGTETARDWWAELRRSPVRVVEAPLEELWKFAKAVRKPGRLSFTDLSLAWLCDRERVREIATADAEFRQLRLVPLFARR